MNVQSSARRRALLAIYAAHRKPRGASMGLRQIERDWRDTGLRRFDLQLAIKDLLQRQWLMESQVDGQCQYELTYLGECAAQAAYSGGPIATVNDWFTLRHARQRVQHQAASPSGQTRSRRASDRPLESREPPREFDEHSAHSH